MQDRVCFREEHCINHGGNGFIQKTWVLYYSDGSIEKLVGKWRRDTEWELKKQ